ncbi:MAG: trypsin-like peptidase domain-containing protein [Bacteroidetes bacterium]|nr:trypsin-like peptidase domain-containing protein [Bacteroidota bacterium]
MVRLLRTLMLVSGLVLVGCQQSVQSQDANSFRSSGQDRSGRVAPMDSITYGRTNAITRAVQVATPAVVSVNVTQTQQIRVNPYNDPFYDFFFGRQRSRVLERQVQQMGSGFVISPSGYIVTNDHVAGNASQITIAFPDGTTLPARLVGTDPGTDLALLKVDPEGELPHLDFELGGPPIVGEWSIALGNPFGLFEASDPTVTVGVVSATGRDLQPQDNRFYTDMIQTDAAINRGNSGGPLLNAQGRVIGVNTAIFSESGGSVGIGFAVPAEKAVRVLEELRDKGFVDRAYYTGLNGRTLPAQWAQALGIPNASGVVVENVDPGSPADLAGFQPYDVIRAFNGERVTSREDFLGYLFEYRPGETVTFEVIRNGNPLNLELELGTQRAAN